jgi:vacuolar-type H+-ATPase subunit H
MHKVRIEPHRQRCSHETLQTSLHKATDEAQSSIQSTLDAAKDAAMKNVKTVQKDGAKAVESVESDASSKQDAAVALIVDRLLNQ